MAAQLMITIDTNRCVGCRNCEYACAFKQKQNHDLKDANICISVYPREKISLPMVCFHCNEAWCMEICPAGAIKRDPNTRAVVIDSQLCIGCKMCMLACPFGNIHFDTENYVSAKCDLCGGDPYCVKFCISGALQFEEINEICTAKRDYTNAKLIQYLKGGNKDDTLFK